MTDKSGVAGVAHWINTHLDIPNEEKVDKSHPAVSRIYDLIIHQYDTGRVTSISDKEMKAFVKRYMPELFISDWDRMKLIAREMAFKIVERFIHTPIMKSNKPKQMEKSMADFLSKSLHTGPAMWWISEGEK